MCADASTELVERRIYLMRGDKVMFDEDLAELYGVETKNLVKAVKRNILRFPVDFMFQLTNQEFANLRLQSGTSSRWGGRRYPPYAFSEQGVAMLSSVLNSARAVQVNIGGSRPAGRLTFCFDLLPGVSPPDGDPGACRRAPGTPGAPKLTARHS